MTRAHDDEALALFRSAVADAVPLQQTARADTRHHEAPTPGLAHRRTAAVTEAGLDTNPLPDEAPLRHAPQDPLSFRRDGVQHGVFRKLKQGAYALESRLDLHRMTVKEARAALQTFISDCMEQELRTVLILHGKGEQSETRAKLKNCVAHWLPLLDAVQAYVSAQPQHGGTGAVYVLLRKSERSRQRNAMLHRR